jgi:hypothetical protein
VIVKHAAWILFQIVSKQRTLNVSSQDELILVMKNKEPLEYQELRRENRGHNSKWNLFAMEMNLVPALWISVQLEKRAN